VGELPFIHHIHVRDGVLRGVKTARALTQSWTQWKLGGAPWLRRGNANVPPYGTGVAQSPELSGGTE